MIIFKCNVLFYFLWYCDEQIITKKKYLNYIIICIVKMYLRDETTTQRTY